MINFGKLQNSAKLSSFYHNIVPQLITVIVSEIEIFNEIFYDIMAYEKIL